MKRGEVFWVRLDPTRGIEIRKTRPAIIVSNDAANRALLQLIHRHGGFDLREQRAARGVLRLRVRHDGAAAPLKSGET